MAGLDPEPSMLLSITTTHQPATDLGYLLGKHPDRCQRFELAYGQAHVFYPEASDDRCTACLVLDLDPVGLVRGRRRQAGDGTLAQYVNDRPYVASSFLSVAIAQVLGSALSGTCKARPELAEVAIPLEAALSVVPCRGGEPFLRALFEPLGYDVEATRIPLDETFPAWGDSRYLEVRLRQTVRLTDLLGHLYVLLPVLDDFKHYWVGRDEIEKLLARGEGWLAAHPARDEIVHRALKHRRALAREALSRLLADDEADPDPGAADDAKAAEEQTLERTVSLNEQRLTAVAEALTEAGARTVVDLGCGEGRLIQRLLRDHAFTRVVGVDVSPRALEIARDRLDLDRLPERRRDRVALWQGALTYRDARLAGFDAACAVEVVEHVDPSRLPAFERAVFRFARPPIVIVTTPNAEYNTRFDGLPAGRFRHRDHRFEWTRAEFEAWAARVGDEHGYAVSFAPIGPVDPALGAPTQMGVFRR
jgi:3' terminal RNA ribose 2'-O-methyltransferase Hen1